MLIRTIYLLAVLPLVGMAGNPLVKDVGMSDPHIRVFDEKVYLYCGHDEAPTDRLWVMKDWRVFSSTDLIDWTQETTISPKDNYMADDSIGCWACDAASRNGKTYFYFSDQKHGIGVMASDSPGGPFTDVLGKPLVAPMHDPTAFIDDDEGQTPYLLYGDKSQGYKIARLNDDMISLAETPRTIPILGKEWEQAPKWMDKSYLFKRNGIYYLSWGRDYATSKNIYGPYTCVGSMGTGHKLNDLAHGSFFEWKGQFYHVWCYYLKNGFKYRETIMTYCHFDAAGNIVTDMNFLNQYFANGVGQYDAAWSKIESEWFYEKSQELHKQENPEGGFDVGGFKDGSWLRFSNMDFGNGVKMFEARISGSGGRIEVRLDSADGPLLGSVDISSGEDKGSVTCPLKGAVGKRDVFLKFTGDSGVAVEMDSFRFF